VLNYVVCVFFGLSQEFYDDLKLLYRATGEHEQSTVFLFSDTQLRSSPTHSGNGAGGNNAGAGSNSGSSSEDAGSFLEDINNILTSGDIPKLFTTDEMNEILSGERLRADATKHNRPITSEAMHQFFLERVRANLHVVMCLSPVGEQFFKHIRMYPALVNCCTIDYFDKWPQSALKEVAVHFLATTQIARKSL
jgi:dynein heavy chain